MSFAWWLSFGVGFLSLSQEILFVRVVSFAQGGTPAAFSLVLTLYLLGIAAGAAIGKRICERSTNLYKPAALALFLAAITDPLAPLLGSYFAIRDHGGLLVNAAVTAFVVAGAAAVKSVLFPIAHHLGSKSSGPHVGSSVSRIYFGNILGATMGPIVTGYFLLEHLSVDECFLAVGLGSGVLALACATRAADRKLWSMAALAFGLLGFIGWKVEPGAFVRLTALRELVPHADATPQALRVAHIIENRHGIIHTTNQPERLDDVVFGGNMFDGRVSADVRHDRNGISRVYILSALHAAPARVLIIGFSGGAWTAAVTGFSKAEHFDIIDINAGYLELIDRYPAVAFLRQDPRIHAHIDDGRRWLKRNADQRYDLIIVNNTIHYRAYATGLLSSESFAELRRHLNSGGILAVNSTGSLDVALTVTQHFAQAYRHGSFLIMSDHDFRPSAEVARQRIATLQLPRQAAWSAADFEAGGAANRLIGMATNLKPVSDLFSAGRGAARELTDNNLLIEYRHGQRLDIPPLSWLLPPKEIALIE